MDNPRTGTIYLMKDASKYNAPAGENSSVITDWQIFWQNVPIISILQEWWGAGVVVCLE